MTKNSKLLRQLTRRDFATMTFGATASLVLASQDTGLASAASGAGAIDAIEHLGMLIRECSLPGETRADGVVPRHANCLQLSRDRWLIVYSTHGYRGVDDERSIIYQIRTDAPDGRVLKEGFLQRAIANWRPSGVDLSSLKPHQTLFKQHGHMVAFGMPQGAKYQGKDLPHAGVFVAKWRTVGRVLDKSKDYLEHSNSPDNIKRAGQGVEWVQFRLSPSGDDLQILQPPQLLRQNGYLSGSRFTSADEVQWMNQSYVPAIPFNANATEWVDINHFDNGKIAAMKYRFNPQSGLYEWIDIGPRLAVAEGTIHEGGIARLGDHWVIAARRQNRAGVAWFKTRDPFADQPTAVLPEVPKCGAPLAAFTCADGVLRLFTGDPTQSPYRNARDPLYCWDVDASQDFLCSNRREIFDSVKAGLKIRKEVHPKIDFCELFPHHGDTQIVCHGVSTRGYNFPYANRSDIPAVNDEEKHAAGVYYARIRYRTPMAPRWEF